MAPVRSCRTCRWPRWFSGIYQRGRATLRLGQCRSLCVTPAIGGTGRTPFLGDDGSNCGPSTMSGVITHMRHCRAWAPKEE